MSPAKRDKKLQITTAAYSDMGTVRKANEDSYFVSKDESLIIICDGMGGQVAGGLASKIAVETIKDVYFGVSEDQILKLATDLDTSLAVSSIRLATAVRIANRRLFTISAKFPKLRGMGTTVVALTFDNTIATMAHVGDSRIFRLSDGEIFQLTEDHSWLNELIEDHEINEEEIETFQQKNVITRALGTAPTVKVDIHCEKYKKNDIYILSTDGLHSSVTCEDMKKMLLNSRGSLETITKKMIEKAKRRDGSDNITAAITQIKQDSRESKQPGVSITVNEEDEKVSAKEDKFIQEKYGHSNLLLTNKAHVMGMIRQNLTLIGAVAVIALFSFFLGMSLQSKQQVANDQMPPLNNPGGKATPNQVMQANINTVSQNAAEPVIQRSPLGRDAVLAFVFFNSQKDYDDAQLDKRGDVLDQTFPFALETPLRGTFSIFLIDSSNNVIRKTSGIQLAEFPDK
jgi:protein phosphatase